jgi:hypothetical protein
VFRSRWSRRATTARSDAAGEPRVPVAAHDRRSADAAERAVPPAAGLVRPAFRRHRGARRRARRAARCRRRCAAAAQDRGPADRDHRRLRAVHAARSERERAGAFTNVQVVDHLPAARVSARARCASNGVRIADPVSPPMAAASRTRSRASRPARPSSCATSSSSPSRCAARRTPSTPRRRSRRQRALERSALAGAHERRTVLAEGLHRRPRVRRHLRQDGREEAGSPACASTSRTDATA